MASLTRSPTSACDSSDAFTYVPMPPFQSRSTGARRIAVISSAGESSVGVSRPSAAPDLGRRARCSWPSSGNTPPPSRDLRRGRSRPSSSRAGRTAACARRTRRPGSGPGRRTRVGGRTRATSRIWSDSSMPLPNTSPDMSPMPTTVNGSVVDVDAELAEVALDRLPGAARRDPELLVVVARRAAGCERVAEPEAVRRRDRVRGVGQRRGALVGRDDEVRVVAVEDPDAVGRDDLAVDEVVGDVEHARHSVVYCRTSSSASPAGRAGGCLSTKPPFAPTGTITAFLTICAFIRPRISVR